MPALEELIAEAMATSSDDTELAKALVESGALDEIVRRGTYDDTAVQKRLDYSSGAGLRAAVSKARHGKGAFPLPILEGRRWSRVAVEKYNKVRRRPASSASPAPAAGSSDVGSTGDA
ncbi:hypothetical protein ACTXMB_15115 [Arthrobacter rhombi]|uniref:hypothetical protein n=1 Tax=Arthrobacter rhombi TaxID=71253 RepID=UPI003FD3D8DB